MDRLHKIITTMSDPTAIALKAAVDDAKTITAKVALYLVNAHQSIDPAKCVIGSDIRQLKDEGFKELADAIRTSGYIMSKLVCLQQHPTKEGWYLVIDGWHRLNAIWFLIEEGHLDKNFRVPAQVYSKHLPRGLMTAYANGKILLFFI